MNMFEEARSIKGMMEMLGATQNEMAKKLSVSQSYVANKLRLLKLSEECERLIISSGLTERHARAVLRLDGDEERKSAISKISERSLTVAQSEALVDLLHCPKIPALVGRAQKLKATDSFLDSIKSSVKSLLSLGIDAKSTVSYVGKKTYVTVTISEDR